MGTVQADLTWHVQTGLLDVPWLFMAMISSSPMETDQLKPSVVRAISECEEAHGKQPVKDLVST